MSTDVDDDPIDRRIFYPLLAVGAACVIWGLHALQSRHVPLRDFGTWFIGGLVLHDAVLAPALVIGGWLVVRRVSDPWRRAVQVAAIVGGAVLLFGIPGLFGDGRDARDPSRLPNDYPRNVALVLALVAVVALSVALAGRRRRRP